MEFPPEQSVHVRQSTKGHHIAAVTCQLVSNGVQDFIDGHVTLTAIFVVSLTVRSVAVTFTAYVSDHAEASGRTGNVLSLPSRIQVAEQVQLF